MMIDFRLRVAQIGVVGIGHPLPFFPRPVVVPLKAGDLHPWFCFAIVAIRSILVSPVRALISSILLRLYRPLGFGTKS